MTQEEVVEVRDAGFLGVLQDGRLCDRRKHPTALPLQQNDVLRIPKAMPIPEDKPKLLVCAQCGQAKPCFDRLSFKMTFQKSEIYVECVCNPWVHRYCMPCVIEALKSANFGTTWVRCSLDGHALLYSDVKP